MSPPLQNLPPPHQSSDAADPAGDASAADAAAARASALPRAADSRTADTTSAACASAVSAAGQAPSVNGGADGVLSSAADSHAATGLVRRADPAGSPAGFAAKSGAGFSGGGAEAAHAEAAHAGGAPARFCRGLNSAQAEAARSFDGPCLISAGAGSGKTRVIVHRIAALIAERNIPIENILAVTFTNKAAREMKERTSRLLQRAGLFSGPTPWIGTFHSICAHILRTNMRFFPKRHSFAIYDASDQLRLIKKVAADLNLNERLHPAKTFRSHINLCKRSAVAPYELHKVPFLAQDKKFLQVYEAYEKALVRLSAFDFESLLLETYRLLKREKQFAEQLSRQFQFLFVDEYQDTNYIQCLLIKQLSAVHQNICVVGDEDQSIYSWRGADISHILNFEREFPRCRVFFLERNYRSTKNIVSAARALIARNEKRKGKALWTENPSGEKILIKENSNEKEESRFISERALQLVRSGGAFRCFCVLYRTNAQSRALEDGLRNLNIPYKIVGNVRFYERAEIKDAAAYLRLVLNPHDDISLLRIINTPRRGLGKASLERLSALARDRGISLFSALKQAREEGMLKAAASQAIRRFLAVLSELREAEAESPPDEIYVSMLDKTGYLESLKRDPEGQTRIENLQELGHVIRQKSAAGPCSLSSFLEEMSLLSESDKTLDQDNAVTLMTLHNSKGLEFPHIVIAGMEEGLFPSYKSIEEGDLEEERRLAYVGVTRAKLSLTLTFALSRAVWGRNRYNGPSRFLSEIPDHLKLLQD